MTDPDWAVRLRAGLKTVRPPEVDIRDEGGHLAVLVDHGQGWQLAMTTPTWRGAGYPEARARGMVEAVAAAVRRRDDILARFLPPLDPGDRVRIYHREIVHGEPTITRTLQPDAFEIAAEARDSSSWTVRHIPTGTRHDVSKLDVVLAEHFRHTST